MLIRAAVSGQVDSEDAASEVCAALADGTPDLAAVWASSHHGPEFETLIGRIREEVNPRNLIGCTCESVIGPDREIESAPGVVLWTAQMPGVRVLPFLLDQQDLGSMQTVNDWQDRLGAQAQEVPTFIIFPDPFSIQFDACLRCMDEAFPGCVVVGGVASAAHERGKNRLFLNDQILRQGLVGVSLSGAVRVSTIVSQGCRPVGPPFVITKAESNVVYELGGKDAYAALREVHQQASAEEKALMRSGVHVGRVVDEHLNRLGPGDFLIRNVAGVVANKGLAVTDFLRAGQTIQFHVRDAETADQEMRSLVSHKMEKMERPPRGGMMFSCNGRGTRLFPAEHHDISVVNEMIPACPVGGFFAAGEIGPVGGRSFVHGFTSSLILFHEP